MPNWVTNKIETSEKVVRAIMNDEGAIDFNEVLPFSGPNDSWTGIMSVAELGAKILCKIPEHSHPLIARLETAHRDRFDIRKLDDESLGQLFGMVENYRACGYLHSMDFNREAWGTKWNACRQSVSPEAGRAEFDTAWNCPEPLLAELSRQFPDETIDVVFAEEDIGSNCGRFTLKNGERISEKIAPSWSEMSDQEKREWSAFAYEVTGREPDPDEEE